MTITTLQEYIDTRWNDTGAYGLNPTITDYDQKLKILTSINDISLQVILDNYGDSALDFLFKYLGGNIVCSRLKASEYSYYYNSNPDVGIYLPSPNIDMNVTSNIDSYRHLTDMPSYISIDTTYDGLRLLK